MDYMLGTEVAVWAPRIASDESLADPATLTGFIRQASAAIEGAVGQSLEIRDFFDEQIPLDANLTGKVRNRPHLGWIEENGTISYFGNALSSQSIALADFIIKQSSGVIRNLAGRPFQNGYYGIVEGGFISRGAPVGPSPFRQSHEQYYVSGSPVATENSHPYFLTASYRAGYFLERNVESSGDPGATQIVLDDVTNIQKGREFYFSTDIENAPAVDRRITAIDTETKTVSFKPAILYIVPVNTTFRMVDKAVRSACADIIEDMLLYPPNTKDYHRVLGRRDLENRWVRMNDFFIPVSAAYKLSDYAKI